MEKHIFTTNDNDFGKVEVKYNERFSVIHASTLWLSNVPSNYEEEVIMTAWDIFKRLFSEYGAVSLVYNEVAEKGYALLDEIAD